jgi:RecA-family ATPase
MTPQQHETPEIIQLQFYRGDELLSRDIPPRDDLVENLIQAKSFNFLAGEEGCGKSLLAMNLAVAVSTGMEKWLSYPIKKSGRVIYLNNELTDEDFIRRLIRMKSRLPTEEHITNLIVAPETPLIQNCWHSLEEKCEREKPVLVILDCLYLAHREDENDSTAMRNLMLYFLRLRNRFNLAVIVVHHTRKGARNSQMRNDLMRGSSVFGGASDGVLMMVRSPADENKRLLKATKGRNISDDSRRTLQLSLDKETLWFSDDGVVSTGQDADNFQTATERINWQEIFGEKRELQYGDILKACAPMLLSDKTIQRALTDAVKVGKVNHTGRGTYELNRPDDANNPSGVL